MSGTMRIGGQRLRFVFPSCLATVRRSDPFLFQTGAAVHFPPRRNDGSEEAVRSDDFGNMPAGSFVAGTETVWLELVDLDARGTVEGDAGRLLAGETLLAEHPDLHERALGVLRSSLGAGFPARLVFALQAMIVSPRGTFKLGPDSFVTAEVAGLSRADNLRLASYADLFQVEEIRRYRGGGCQPAGQLTSLELGRTRGSLDSYEAFAALKQGLRP